MPVRPGKDRLYMIVNALVLCIICCLAVHSLMAQSGEDGISAATEEVAEYFDLGIDLMYAVGALLGLVGAVKVYSKWNGGDQDTSKVAASWFGSCIFLIVVATILRGFFLGN